MPCCGLSYDDLVKPIFYERPPVGLIPKKIWVEYRRDQIFEAIERYAKVKKDIPVEWFEEYIECSQFLKNNMEKNND